MANGPRSIGAVWSISSVYEMDEWCQCAASAPLATCYGLAGSAIISRMRKLVIGGATYSVVWRVVQDRRAQQVREVHA